MRSRKITTRIEKMDCSILKLGDKWRKLCKWKGSSKIDQCLEMINVTPLIICCAIRIRITSTSSVARQRATEEGEVTRIVPFVDIPKLFFCLCDLIHLRIFIGFFLFIVVYILFFLCLFYIFCMTNSFIDRLYTHKIVVFFH